MKKIIGSLFTIGGLISVIITGYHYMNHSSSVHALGATVTIHNAPLWPLALSGVIFILGVVILVGSQGK